MAKQVARMQMVRQVARMQMVRHVAWTQILVALWLETEQLLEKCLYSRPVPFVTSLGQTLSDIQPLTTHSYDL